MTTVSRLPGAREADAPAPGLLRLAWPIFAEQGLHIQRLQSGSFT